MSLLKAFKQMKVTNECDLGSYKAGLEAAV